MTATAHISTTRSSTPRWRRFSPRSLFRQRNKLGLARHFGEASGFPIGFRLLDPCLRARDQIPPDMPLAFELGAAEDHEPRRLLGGDGGRSAAVQHQQLML